MIFNPSSFVKQHSQETVLTPPSSPPDDSAFGPLSVRRIEAARERHGTTVDRYLAYLQAGDPLMDALVEYHAARSPERDYLELCQAIDRGIESIEDPPPPLTRLFEELDHVPFWVDWDRLRIASRKIIRNGLLTSLSFATYALPHIYLATANKPLGITRHLFDEAAQRYARTSRFVTDVFMPDGLMRHADGFRLVVLVRHAHARMRRGLLASGVWDPEHYETPINQAHVAVSAVFFSLFVVHGLQRLGVRFSAQEMESVILTWRYVSFILGVDPELIGTSEQDAERLVAISRSLELDADDLSRRLLRSTIESGPRFLGIEQRRMAKPMIHFTWQLVRRMLGDTLADALDVPRQTLPYRLAVRGLPAVVTCLDRAPWLFPRAVRNFVGVEFWLMRGDYDEFIKPD